MPRTVIFVSAAALSSITLAVELHDVGQGICLFAALVASYLFGYHQGNHK